MEAVGYMAGGVAHNFNNNLSIILGNLELVQMKQQPGSEDTHLLESARTAVLRSRDLVRKIITYSQKRTPHKAPTRLTDLIEETFKLLKVTLPSTINLETRYCSGCDNWHINADASQFQEILINLCNNAVNAMDEYGDLKISLDPFELQQNDIPAHYEALPGQYAKFSVQDTGCGIPEDMLDKIFDPFYTTKEDYEGAGMGLATVQGIVAQHNGLIKVDSIQGQGTTFDLYIPLLDTHQKQVDRKPENNNIPSGKERILYVDDNQTITTIGKTMLSEIGYNVSTMNDSQEALKYFTGNADQIDLVITDQTMPNLTGQELIQEIKKIRPATRTILCTGYSSKIDKETAIEQGISAFLMKPFELKTLSQTVRQVLDEKVSIG